MDLGNGLDDVKRSNISCPGNQTRFPDSAGHKESGRKKKRSEIQALKVQDKKITDQQIIAETFNEYSVAIAENINSQN